MRQVSGDTWPLSVLVLTVGIMVGRLGVAAEPAATDFIVSTADKQCDEFNRSWVVLSKHSYLSIKVTVHWSAVGAKEMQEEFILSPGGNRAIGCASKLEIVSAEIMQF